MKNRHMSMKFIAGMLVMALCAQPVGMIRISGIRASAAETIKPGTVPQADWDDDKWDAYREAVGETLTENQKAYYFDLDGVAMTDMKAYYKMGGGMSSGQTFESDFISIPQSEKFPGCFIFDRTLVEDGSNKYPYGNYYIYDKNETEIFNYLISISNFSKDYIVMDGGKVDVLHCYTVSYEQGSIETRQLPETKYYYDGQELGSPWERTDIDSGISGYSGKFYDSRFFAGGYGLSHWEDQDGVKYNNGYDSTPVTKKTVLHPVYVNEQNMKLKERVEKVGIKSAEELLEHLAVPHDGEILLINSDIVVDSKTVNSFKQDSGNKEHPYFYWADSLVIVESGGSLTFDGVEANVGSIQAGSPIVGLVVQSGGKLNLINHSSAYKPNEDSGLFLSVQENAQVNVKGAWCWELYGLSNYGTIRLSAPDETTEGTSSDDVNMTYLHVGEELFNAKKGTIQIDYGKIRIDNDHRSKYNSKKIYNTYSEKDFKTCFIPGINRGTIKVCSNGGIEMSGSSSSYQNDRSYLVPFMNEGTITCDACPTGKFYGSPVELQYSVLQNRKGGKITVEQPEHTSGYGDDIEDYISTSVNPGMDMLSSVLINEGEYSVKAVSVLGARIDGQYFNPADYLDGKYETGVTEIQYAGIDNRESGVINLESTKGSVAMNIMSGCILDNKGRIVISNTDKSVKANNITLCSSGKINNDGIIENNGAIGYRYAYNNTDMMSYNGTPYTGTGNECYYYYLRAVDGSDDSLPETVSVDIKVNDEKVGTVKGSSSFYGFFPAGETFNVVMTADGYADGKGQFTAAKNLDAYMYENNDDNPDRHSGFIFAMLSSGESGAGTGGTGDGGAGTGDAGTGGTGAGGAGAGGTGTGDAGAGGTGAGGAGTGGTGTGDAGAGGTGNGAGTGTGAENAGTPGTAEVTIGKKVTDSSGKARYEVTSVAADGTGTVAFVGAVNSKSVKSYVVGNAIDIDGKAFRITSIAGNAFKNCTRLKKVTIGTNVTAVGKSAFEGCKSLKTIIIKSAKLKSVGKKAFAGINRKAVIKVPKKQLKNYKKLFNSACGIKKTMKIKK